MVCSAHPLPASCFCYAVCVEPDTDCACTERTSACSGIEHSTCNTQSDQCTCDSGYVAHEGECQLISGKLSLYLYKQEVVCSC